jgi:two-component system NtrC family sensor kinase
VSDIDPTGSTALRTPTRTQPGLRLQIVLSLAGLMLLAFVPLFFAVASLARATVQGARERAARDLGRVVAEHAASAYARADRDAVAAAVAGQAGRDGVEAICAFTPAGVTLACGGRPIDVGGVVLPAAGSGESARTIRGSSGREVEVFVPGPHVSIAARIALDGDAERDPPLVRLVALYMSVFALALLVFAYFALTRLIVRPVDQLVDAADRVATGARTLGVPRAGARELVELGVSVQAMAEKLIAEKATLVAKVEQLTETTSRLTQTRAQLVRSERMASVGRLAAGVAHEIGNPIAALMGIQDLLLEGGQPPEAQQDFVQRMRRETERIHTVVRDLLDFARPEAPGEVGARSHADVRAVAEDVVALVRPQRFFRSVEVEMDVPATLEVALPAPRLTQVLLNVLLNAGAAVAAHRGRGRVVIRARSLEPRALVRIEVEDDGPGVDASIRDRLFEPFVTTKDVGEGTGLGLAVCRGLVESAGGEIDLDPSYAGGARFYVVLPGGLAKGSP